MFKLISDVATRRAPPKLLAYGTLNFLNRWFRTGNRRFEFERLYAEHGDIWNFSTSEYEHTKYAKTLDLALKHCPKLDRALEVGCGTGVFSGLLAQHFRIVVATDISGEVLRIAAVANRSVTNIQFLREDFRRLTANARFDLVVCAEVLYYLRETDSKAVCQALDRLLGSRGVILTVSGIPQSGAANSGSGYFNGWNETFSRRFTFVESMDVTDTGRPYRIAAFRHNDNGSA